VVAGRLVGGIIGGNLGWQRGRWQGIGTCWTKKGSDPGSDPFNCSRFINGVDFEEIVADNEVVRRLRAQCRVRWRLR